MAEHAHGLSISYYAVAAPYPRPHRNPPLPQLNLPFPKCTAHRKVMCCWASCLLFRSRQVLISERCLDMRLR